MEGSVRGDIVVIPFPFSDLSAAKRRPALVLAVLANDVVLCQITSHNRLDDNAVEIRKEDFEEGRLPVASYVRCGKIFTASSSILEKKAGRLRSEPLAKIARRNAEIILGNI